VEFVVFCSAAVSLSLADKLVFIVDYTLTYLNLFYWH